MKLPRLAPLMNSNPAEVGQAKARYRFDIILCFLLMMYFSLAFAPIQIATILSALLVGMSWMWVFRGEQHKAGLFLARTLTTILVGSLITIALLATQRGPQGLLFLMFVASLFGLPFLILHRVLSRPDVGYQTVMGALCVYLLIGLLFAFLYVSLDRILDTPLFGDELSTLPKCLYFSFVTLTSLGFGDIAPTTSAGRALVPLEALLGQTYMATLVARLVGLMTSRDVINREKPPQ